MTASTTPHAESLPYAEPGEFGIGLRYSLHPATDNFVDVILGAIDATERAGLGDGLRIRTDEVGTLVEATRAPAEQLLATYLTHTVAAAARLMNGGHLVTHVLLSRGCPGEVSCDLKAERPPQVAPVELEDTGILAVVQWSLYPLMDGDGTRGAHLEPIERAIAAAGEREVTVEASTYSTRLRGDLARVIATVTDAWSQVGTTLPHVVTHATISISSPTVKDQP